jgi:hypothetical protein
MPRISHWAFALLVILSGETQAEHILYDGSLNTTPDRQGWTYLTDPPFGADATQSASGGYTTLNTTFDTSERAGYFRGGPLGPALDRNAGLVLTLDARLAEESHVSNDRAGFSLIVITSDLLGIELGFWEDEIWAQSDSPLFTRAEGAAFDTTQSLTRYELSILGTTYALSAGGTPILSGGLRDYTAFVGLFDPYETPNLIFLGDNTSSADARVEIARVGLTIVPEPSSVTIFALGLVGLALRQGFRRRGTR